MLFPIFLSVRSQDSTDRRCLIYEISVRVNEKAVDIQEKKRYNEDKIPKGEKICYRDNPTFILPATLRVCVKNWE